MFFANGDLRVNFSTVCILRGQSVRLRSEVVKMLIETVRKQIIRDLENTRLYSRFMKL